MSRIGRLPITVPAGVDVKIDGNTITVKGSKGELSQEIVGDINVTVEDGTNTVVGRHVGLDASRNIVYTDGPDDVVITLGVHDLVIVKRGNAVMLVHKDRVQEIKTLLADERMAALLDEVGRER